MTRIYVDYLRDMLDNAKRALRFDEGMDYSSFSKDEKSVYAVIRAVEIIGEATRNIPEELRVKYPEIPWRDVSDMRNKLVHNYFGINLEVIWQTLEEDIPLLADALQNIIRWEENSTINNE
ncbi:MAG TPA: DUF86 domain-containing protein [Anaerolineales bacterium]|nr:DUF86 domain-containing protein [Anaerolineales bacterium]HND49194.1 DUF86 domain-containing protein [Anaerolineales bacterium]